MILKNKKPDKNKLIAFGFSKQGSGYVYRTELLGGQTNEIIQYIKNNYEECND